MSMNRPEIGSRRPTMPRGEEVASYATYSEAQSAVSLLAEREFPVRNVAIVGTDLRVVERVSGRLNYSRSALAGLVSGAWLGLFFGLVQLVFSSADTAAPPLLPPVAIGGALGILLSLFSYSRAKGRRSFTSKKRIVASAYVLVCAPEHAHQARVLLKGGPGGPGAGASVESSCEPLADPPADPPVEP